MALSPRSTSLDALRVFGLIAVVVGHVWADETRLSIYTWHVPLFFFLTGYLWKDGRGFRLEASRRFKSLIIPLLSWGIVLLTLVLALMFYQRRFSYRAVIEDIQDGEFHTKPFMVFWFVLVLFFVALALRALEKLPHWVSWVAALCGLAVAFMDGAALSAIPLSIGLTLPCMFFALTGIGFRRMRRAVNLPIGVTLLVFSAALIGFGVSDYLDIKPGHFGTPVLSMLVATAISVGLVVVFESIRLPPAISRAVTTLASVGLAVVLGHATLLAFTEGFHPAISLQIGRASCRERVF